MPSSELHIREGGREWILHRPGDLESYWQEMTDRHFDADERLPYWVEVWPAGLRLATWLGDNSDRLAGRACLDLGCGLGLSTCAARAAGAKAVGVDYEPDALRYARINEQANGLEGIAWAVMDWRRPAFAPGQFPFICGADILYERRFTEPLAGLFAALLAPGGRIWITEPIRDVSAPAWAFFRSRGWKTRLLNCEKTSFQDMTMRVNLWEMRRR
ncbi:class I SAM-dependent methyltransferase [Desulfohalobium retbaense]|uniref:Methyltransferase type 12 n=1 Tax=Desulfohalobium retbaense (strain ATCC 49708 / DSM 5692 / JCM 16813 / HR100) TaxID=485915 RepID=C8WZN8_DESRD|nr:methyltransferase domain-containing protein [Desulfohalobium retbaense]ACV67513.1 Methyltransferase type 12 [Desulfohalobium retbaense DSM 5692]